MNTRIQVERHGAGHRRGSGAPARIALRPGPRLRGGREAPGPRHRVPHQRRRTRIVPARPGWISSTSPAAPAWGWTPACTAAVNCRPITTPWRPRSWPMPPPGWSPSDGCGAAWRSSLWSFTNAELSILYHPEFILGECTTAFLDEHLSELLEFSRKLSESGVDA